MLLTRPLYVACQALLWASNACLWVGVPRLHGPAPLPRCHPVLALLSLPRLCFPLMLKLICIKLTVR